MASNLSIAKSKGEVYLTISKEYGHQWHNFTLQNGHMFGYSPELVYKQFDGLFVVYQIRKDPSIPAQNETIRVYRHSKADDSWSLFTVHKKYCPRTVERIHEVAEKRIGGVTLYRNTEKYAQEQKRAKYDTSDLPATTPYIVTDYDFTPMPSMRIPMGKRGKTPSVTMKRSHSLTAQPYGDSVSKQMREMKIENSFNVSEIHRARINMDRDAIGVMK